MSWRTWTAALLLGASLHAADLPGPVQALFDRLDRTEVPLSYRAVPLAQVLRELGTAHQLTITWPAAAEPLMARPVTLREPSISLSRLLFLLCQRNGLQWSASNDGKLLLALAEGTDPDRLPPTWVANAQPVQERALPNRYRSFPPPGGWRDPVPAITGGDEARWAKPTAKTAKEYLAGYLDRIEASLVASARPSAGLVAMMKADPVFRRDLLSAISWQFDDAPAALTILETLRAQDPKRFAAFHHLALALAVVHDQPNGPISSRYYTLWAVEERQFGPPMDWQAVWTWFTDARRQSGFRFKPSDLAWPLLVHLVDLDVSQVEAEWALARYRTEKDLGVCYQQVPYDNAKLARRPTALGDSPYVLENLLTKGGVCVDQAHYASRVAKALGVPSMKCAGQGRYGGAGHAWSGYLAAKGRTPSLEFTGRYFNDFYYTGEAFDPQLRVETLDRYVALLYAGVAGQYESYTEAGFLTRAALACEADQPAIAAVLARAAISSNAYVADAWRLAGRLAAQGAIPPKDAATLLGKLLKILGPQHPDLVVECHRQYLDLLPATPLEPRLKVYADLYTVCGGAKRPDLQIRVRLDELAELAAANRPKDVITKAFEAVGPNIAEGALVMPLVRQVVTLSKDFAAKDPNFRIQLVKDALQKYAKDFPQQRGNEVSPAWQEYQTLMQSL